ncbi:Myb/SANT-like DNA-binding domain [Popillia japonica]|uniref:Myb/SANT-like DNA-binding domain n=1 Tax=Popillia japonica TaxID=7064 RepID=A0AAW1LBE0_POPJA
MEPKQETIYLVCEPDGMKHTETNVDVNHVYPTNEEEYKMWSSNSTRLLINYYKTLRGDVGSSKMRNLRKLWETIAMKMKEEHNLKYTPAHCENRWRVMARNYRRYMDNTRTKRRRKFFEFSAEMDEIFKKENESNAVMSVPITNLVGVGTSQSISSPNNVRKMQTVTVQNLRSVPLNYQGARLDLIPNNCDIRRKTEEDKINAYNRRTEVYEKKCKLIEERLKAYIKRTEVLEERNRILLRTSNEAERK